MATKKVVRTGSAADQNFTETTEGTDYLQNTLEVSVNAKGYYQYSIKFSFASAEDLAANGTTLAAEFDQRFRAKFVPPNRSE